MTVFNKNLFLKELKMNLPGVLIWSFCLGALSFLGLAFYPVLTEDGLITQMSTLFENSMMRILFSAFGFDLKSILTVSGFYMAYMSIYFILIAAIYAIMRGASLIAKEENLRTADFLLTRPIGRLTVYITKSTVLILLLFILNLTMTVTGLSGMNIFKNEASLSFNQSRSAYFEAAFKKQPALFRETFGLNEKDYLHFLLVKNLDQIKANPRALEDSGLDGATINQLIEKGLQDPEGFMDEVQNDPEKYIALFDLNEEQQEIFYKEIEQAEKELSKLSAALAADPALYIPIYTANPAVLMDKYKFNAAAFHEFCEKFSIPAKVEKDAFIYYRLDHFIILSIYIYLLMLFLSGLGNLISLLVKRGAPITGLTVGITFLFYFIDRIAQIIGDKFPLYLFTPFRWVDTNITSGSYGLDPVRTGFLLGGAVIFYLVSYNIFRKKDILV